MRAFFAAAAFAACASAASAATVDFSTNFGRSLAEGTEVLGFDFGAGLTGRVSVVGGAGEARIFDTTPGSIGTLPARRGGGGDPDLAGPFRNVDDPLDIREFGNALIIQERSSRATAIPDDEARGGTITFTFDRPIDLMSLVLLDGEEDVFVTTGARRVGNAASSGDNLFDTILFDGSARRISEFTVNFGGSGAIGEFEAISAIPLPATLPLALAALAALGFIARRRRGGSAE